MLAKLHIQNFRNFKDAAAELDPDSNVFFGSNAAGKTSLLESIFFLSRGRSFLTRNYRQLIHQDSDSALLFAELSQLENSSSRLGVQIKPNELLFRINQQAVKRRYDLWQAFPVHIVAANTFLLLSGPPQFRRNYIDWGMFHVKHSDYDQLLLFQKVLRQRNASLKSQRPESEIKSWNDEYCRLANLITESRVSYIDELSSCLSETIAFCVDFPAVKVNYRQGWKTDLSIEEALASSLMKDKEKGFTSVGPHRADVLFRVNAHDARTRLSRGQLKLLIILLVVSQLTIRQNMSSIRGLLLLDDLASELDPDNFKQILSVILQLGCQTIISMVGDTISSQYGDLKSRMFHVKHGDIRPG
ncbi:MAG: DNA replication and repair protein RecF [gamma proteobacterium symbiont of Bathyaustriella thionipta]|nr:DNA replication and repair protein RecF [gamma proteobacterium symbiont of Bathyaustriella thionipta]